MSELIYKKYSHENIRWKLLAGVSVLALTVRIGLPDFARAEDADRPTVWIELGGQLSRLQDGEETFSPPIMENRPSTFEPSQNFEKPPANSFDAFGAISVQPKNSDWIFNVSARYGRSKSNKHALQQTNPEPSGMYISPDYTLLKYPKAQRFAETTARTSEQHAILDFQVGKDVGLGMFGGRSPSVVSLGIRFAQFKSTSNITLRSDPDWAFGAKYAYGFKIPIQTYHSRAASLSAYRNFHGIGPSVSWNASVPVLGNSNAGELFFDWGVNAALLFGRQKTRIHHQTTGRYHTGENNSSQSPFPVTYRGPATPDHTRSRGVTVPNIGGFAGLSFKYPNAKISLGYRADFFFGAVDGGIDTRQEKDLGFHGPFATLSVGLGG